MLNTWITVFQNFLFTREFLLSFAGISEADLLQFGANEDLLNGYVCFNQFAQVNSNAVIDQMFLLNGFTRSCAYSLPHQAKGADSIVPVLKSSGTMGCIAIQFQNFQPGSKFPLAAQKTSKKLSAAYPNFLNYDKCGDFPAVSSPEDSPCADYRYASIFDAKGWTHYQQLRAATLQEFKDAGVAEYLLNYRSEFGITIKPIEAPETKSNPPSAFPGAI